MFINFDTVAFDFTGVFLPVKIDSITRWDSRDGPDLDEEFKGGIWTYFIARTWAPLGPFKSDYIITNSAGRVLFTIEGFEIARAPEAEPVAITDSSMEERLTTLWQPKTFSAAKCALPPVTSASSYLSTVFESLAKSAQVDGARHVIRVLDLDSTAEVAKTLDATLTSLLQKSQLAVDYFCAGTSADVADAKTGTLQYPRARSLVVDASNVIESGETPVAK